MEKIIDKVKCTKTYIGKSDLTSGNAYRVTLSYNGKTTWFVFNDNCLNESDKKEFLGCLIMDSCSYDCCRNLDDFINEFGYEKQVSNGIKAFNGCKKQHERLNKLFSSSEQSQLIEELESC